MQEKKMLWGKIKQENVREKDEYFKIRGTIDQTKPITLRIDERAIFRLAFYLKGKSFKDATQEDMIGFDGYLRENYNESTACLFETKIKMFYKYLYNKAEYKKGKQFQKNINYPDNVAWFKTTSSNGNTLPIEEILTDVDVKRLLDACKNVREQVVICSLLDGGLREHELCQLKNKNVGFDKTLGAYFILPKQAKSLKTGMRKVQLFLVPSSTLYIKEYLNHHLFKDDPEAYFIYQIANVVKDKGKNPIAEASIYRIVMRIAKDSKVKKKIAPHILRHNSATRCAMKGFNEFMMRERFGWSKSSTMPSVYVHLAGADIDNKIKQILGIEEPEEQKESILQPIICPNCTYENAATNVVCGRCGMKLNISKEDLGVDATTTGIATQKLLDDPDVLKQMIDMLSDRLEKKLQNEK